MWRLWRLSVRQFAVRWGRSLLTLVSVIIGVAAVVAVTLSSGTTRRAYSDISNALSGRASLEVVAPAGEAFAADAKDTIAGLPGVEAVVPQVQRWTILYFGEHHAKVMTLGIDPASDSKVRDYRIADGEFLSSNTDQQNEEHQSTALLDASFAKSIGAKVGDEVRIIRGRSIRSLGMERLKIVGLLTPTGISGIASGGTVFVPIAAAQRIFNAPGKVDALEIVAKSDTTPEKLQQELAAALPPHLTVQAPAMRTSLSQETLQGAEEALRLAGVLSLVLSIFIILNTFLMSVTERRPQIAVLRAVGATRRQTMRMLLLEGVVLGVVGSALGIVAGIGGAFLLNLAVEQLMQTQLPTFAVPVMPLVMAAMMGIGLSITAAYIPAVRASRISPLEGLGVGAVDEFTRMPRRLLLAGGLLVAVCGTMLALSMTERLAIEFAVPSGAGVLVGFVLMVPAGLRPMSWMAAWLPGMVVPAETKLARGQLVTHPIRAMLTVGVLFIALAACVTLGTTILNNIQDVSRWVDRTVGVADYFVRAMMPDMATGLAADIPESVGDELKKVDGIASIARIRRVRTQVDGTGAVLTVRDFSPSDTLPLDLKVGKEDQVREQLRQGDVVLGSMLASRKNLTIGNDVTLDTLTGPKKFRVAGVANEYTVGGLTLFMSRDVAEREMGISGVDAYVIKAEPGEAEGVGNALQHLTEESGLILQSAAGLRGMVDSMMAGVVGCLWGLLALAVVVAAFGIVNTLTMNVLEQTRELAVLRVVAMTRRQIRRTILCQAAILGVIGLVPGAIIGSGLAWLMHVGTVRQFGHGAGVYSSHPAFVLGLWTMAYAVVVIAAMLPAERAARLNLLTALHYE